MRYQVHHRVQGHKTGKLLSREGQAEPKLRLDQRKDAVSSPGQRRSHSGLGYHGDPLG